MLLLRNEAKLPRNGPIFGKGGDLAQQQRCVLFRAHTLHVSHLPCFLATWFCFADPGSPFWLPWCFCAISRRTAPSPCQALRFPAQHLRPGGDLFGLSVWYGSIRIKIPCFGGFVWYWYGSNFPSARKWYLVNLIFLGGFPNGHPLSKTPFDPPPLALSSPEGLVKYVLEKDACDCISSMNSYAGK